MRLLRSLCACLLLFAAAATISDSHAQYTHVPDRCPEPCRIGGTHVTPDYQRMTVPFLIRNADTGLYLKLNDRSVAVAPLVEDDHSFLWVLMPSKWPQEFPGDSRAIVRNNGFEEDRLYKLMNLQHGEALLRSDGSRGMRAAATHEGANQYFLVRKNPGNGRYILYNPDTTSVATDAAIKRQLQEQLFQAYLDGNHGGANGVRDTQIKLQKVTGRIEVSIDAGKATFATMPALMVPQGRKHVEARSGASFGASGFDWHLEESSEPMDLARLTIRYIDIFKPSAGHDTATDIAIMGADFVAGLGADWAIHKFVKNRLSKGYKDAIRSVRIMRANLGSKEAQRALAEQAAREAAQKNFFQSTAEAIAKDWGGVVGTAAQRSLSERIGRGALYVTAAPFRAGWWITKGTGRFIKRKSISIAKDKWRPIARALKEAEEINTQAAKYAIDLQTGKYARAVFNTEGPILKFLGERALKNVLKPILRHQLGDDAYTVLGIDGAGRGGRTVSENQANLGGDVGEIDTQGELGRLRAEKAKLEAEWGGARSHFEALAEKTTDTLNPIDPNLAYIIRDDNYNPKSISVDVFGFRAPEELNKGPREYFTLDYIPEQTIYKELFEDGEEIAAYNKYLAQLKTERAAVSRSKLWRPFELSQIRQRRGWTEQQFDSEVRRLRQQIIDAENKEFALRSLEERIEEIELFQLRVKNSPNPALVLGDRRVATYEHPFYISDATYDKCFDTKPFAIPATNGPYGRLASAQAGREVAEFSKTVSRMVRGDLSGADSAMVGTLLAMDLAFGGFGTLAEEFKLLSELSDDQVEMYIDGRHVWPNGGSGHRNMGKNNRRDRVDVEHIFRRGDTIRIKLVEDDSGSNDDDMGTLTIHTRHLLDSEPYERVYIQSLEEKSLYAVEVVLEPFYAPTPEERKREAEHQRDCDDVLKQIEAQEFAYNVEQTRINGRIALLDKMGEDALKTFDQNAYWAHEDCKYLSFDRAPRGEWRVGRYLKSGGRDYSVTWTNTFAPITNRQRGDYTPGEGIIVTPRKSGIWNTRNWSSMYYTQRGETYLEDVIEKRKVVRQDKRWRWLEPSLESDSSSERERNADNGFYGPVARSDDSCEIYALMYGSDGQLGSMGRQFTHPSDRRSQEEQITNQLEQDPELIAKRAEVEQLFDDGDPYRYRQQKELARLIWRKRQKLEEKLRQEPKYHRYFEVLDERVFALRGNNRSDRYDARMYQIADSNSEEYKAVQFLNAYYSVLPDNRSRVNANLRMPASGPAGLWMEKISDDPGGKAREANDWESHEHIQKIRQYITGAWAIAPYGTRKSFFHEAPKADPDDKVRWIFTESGSFVSQPARDFWFTPPIEGSWEYIGDQRIAVTTKVPVRVAVAAENAKDSGSGFHNLGTSFILKMQQTRFGRTEFDGFIIQDADGQKILWSEQVHPDKSPFEVSDQYSSTFLDLLSRVSQRDGSPVPETYLKIVEANKAASAAKLAELQKLHAESPCTMEVLAGTLTSSWQRSDPGWSALHGKWRVGQYSPSGEKQYLWNYQRIGSPSWLRTKDEWRELGRVYISGFEEDKLKGWRPDDYRLADNPRIAFERPNKVGYGGYQQEWHFHDPEEGRHRSSGLTISTRIDGGYFRYHNGDLAPLSADRRDVVKDPQTGEFKIKLYEGYADFVHKDGLGQQKIIRQTMEARVGDNGCQPESSVGLPKLTGERGLDLYNINFIYHENGDKEFYILKEDGSLFLWGLQDVDHTKYKYKYDQKIIPVAELGHLCTRNLTGYWRSNFKEFASVELPYFTGYREGDLDPGDSFELENYGLEKLKVISKAGNLETAYYSYDLLPGEHVRMRSAKAGEKISLLTEDNECLGQLTNNAFITAFRVGNGYEPPAPKHTNSLSARETCGEYVTTERFGGRPATVKLSNSGSIPLVIYRIGDIGELANADGRVPPRRDDYDPDRGSSQYHHLREVTTLEPGGTYELKTRVGHAYTAITQSTFHFTVWGVDGGRERAGEPETCFGKFKVSEASETIDLNGDLTEEEFQTSVRDRDFKIREDNRIANNLSLISDTDPNSNTVSEGAKPGTPVGIVARADDGDEGDTVSYSVAWPGENDDLIKGKIHEFFKIDSSTGQITVSGSKLDYETSDHHVIAITAASSDGSVSIKEFTVAVEDFDEFDVGPISTWNDDHRTWENSEVGSQSLGTFMATDEDGTDTVSYSLSEDADGRFRIDPESGDLTNAAVMDHEEKSRHEIVVVATSTDGSQSSKAFVFEVVDVDEFDVEDSVDSDDTPNTVSENAPEGTPVGITARANDADGTDNTITYSISRSGVERLHYQIDPKTGVITTLGSFDQIDLEEGTGYDNRTWQYRFTLGDAESVTVKAESSDGSRSFTTFEIEVLDANDFEIGNVVDVDYEYENVLEDAAVGTLVGITAKAIDQDVTAKVSYNLSNNAGDRFAIDPATGVVTVNGLLDYESTKQHMISVVATSDDGSSSTSDFKIQVANVNEFPIDQVADVDPAANTVPENMDDGRFVIGVTAQAADPDSDSQVTYSLRGVYPDGQVWVSPGQTPSAQRQPDAPLLIDAKSGVVTANWSQKYERESRAFDYETQHIVQFDIVATSDDGSVSATPITLLVTNIDDNPVANLVDTNGEPNTITENAKVGTPVGITASASDADGDPVSYSLDYDSGRFAIDPRTGVVTLATDYLDAEVTTSRHVVVVATGSDGSTVAERFDIQVEDLNENDIYAMSDWDQQFDQISEDAPVGSHVGIQARAEDPDATDGVKYQLSNDADGRFAIDAETGVVTLAKVIGRDPSKSYTIEATATSDDGSTSSKTFEIAVNWLNNNSVTQVVDVDSRTDEVDEYVYRFGEEDNPGPFEVGITARAEDADFGDSVTYSIVIDTPDIETSGGMSQRDREKWRQRQAQLGIDPKTGVVTSSQLDRESVELITGTITATSTDGSSSSMPFNVRINDINEFRLQSIADADQSPNTVEETARIGTPVGITALAKDLDPSDTVSYRMANGSDGRFAVHPQSGVVTLAGPLDLDVPDPESELLVQVEAVSSDGSSIDSGWQFRVNVTPVDEHPLTRITDIDDRPNRIGENAEKGSEIGIQLFASDADNPDWTPEYEITAVTGVGTDPLEVGYESPFLISRTDGEKGVIKVFNSRPFDPSISTQVSITVTAKSYANPALQVNEREETFVVEIIPKQKPEEPQEPETPTFVNWYDDPQDPRGGNDYSNVSQDDWNQCLAANEDPTSARFNNEKMFYDCVDRKQADANPDNQRPDLTPDQLANGCGEYGKLASQEREGGAMVMINNIGSVKLNIFLIDETGADVNYQGENYPLREVEAGDTSRFETRRGRIFSVLDEAGNCVGIAKTRESRNEYSFGTDGSLGGPVVAETPTEPQQPAERPDNSVDTGTTVTWYDNPQDPREGNSYGEISNEAWGACVTANETPGTAQFNNETAYYDCLDAALAAATNNQERPQITWYDNPQDPRRNNDYNAISEVDWNACIEENEDPGSPRFNDEEGFYDCLEMALVRDDEPVDLNPGGLYSALPEDVLQTCQGDINCLDAAVMQAQRADAQAIQNRLDNEFANATQENLDNCEANHGWGSDDFFWCLGQTVVADNGNGGDTDGGREPGWDRADVLFQPAYDHCVYELGLDDQSEEYGICYYAYDHRLGRVPDNDNQDLVGSQDPVGTNEENAPTSYADASCQEQGTRVSEYLEREALVTVQNDGTADLAVYWIGYEGEPGNYEGGQEPLATVPPGQSEEIDAYRGFVFLVTDMRGDCLGLIEARESRNSKSFIPGGGQDVSDSGQGQSDNTQATQWYDDPKDPRSSNDYSVVSPDDWDACYAVNEDVNSTKFNNEYAFWNCMDTALARTASQGADNDNQTASRGPSSCLGNGEVSEYIDNEALVTISNEGSTPLYVYWVNYEGREGDYDGSTAPLLTVNGGQTEEINAYRGFVFSVLDQTGICLGVVRARESRNSRSFNPDNADQAQMR